MSYQISKRMKLQHVLALSAISIGVLVSCGGELSVHQPTSVVTPSTPASADLNAQGKYSFVLVDAITGERITDELNVSFSGAASVVDGEGKSINGTSLKTSDGLVAVGANFKTGATEFSILVGNRALGWVETGTRIVGDTSTSEEKTIEIKLLNTNKVTAINADTNKAITMSVQSVTPIGNVVTAAAITQTTPPKTVTNAEGNPESTGAAVLTIPAGVKAVDPVTGAVVIPTGNLTISTTKFSNAEAGALSAFPGGFAATISNPNSTATIAATAAVGGADGGAFVTGGFAQFNVTDSTGKALKQFDKPLSVSIDLPRSSLNENGVAVKAGDTYPVWSFNDETGAWNFEKNGLIQEKNPIDLLNFTVAFDTNHLSSWNLDLVQRRCTGRITLTGRTDARPLRGVVTGVPGNRFHVQQHGITDNTIQFQNVPARTRAKVELFDGGVLVGSSPSSILICDAINTINVRLPAIAAGTVKVDVTESCANGTNKRALPTATYLERGAVTRSQNATTLNGIASASYVLVPSGGLNWNAKAYNKYTKKIEAQFVSVSQNTTSTAAFNFTMPCAVVTGGSS